MPVRRRGREPFAARLLGWFDRQRRDLPWRRTRDPWAIWVSEVMLQQTRVEAVRAAFERFVARYPTPAAFAAAGDDELLLAWRGLGYYRRARLLRDGARAVVREHAGRVPSAVSALAELPGVGAYTCGAIASIAFGHGELAIDGNVERVVARHRGVRERIDSPPARQVVRTTVAGWIDRSRPGDFNQALMELGAVVCTPSSPRCGHCPVASDCVGFAAGDAAQLPVKKAPRPAVGVSARALLVLGSAGALGHRVPAGEPNAGQIELPGPGVLVSAEPAELAAAVRARFGAAVDVGPVVATVRHAITWHRIVLRAHAATVRRRGRLQWFALSPDTPWTTPARKVFGAAIDAGAPLRA